MKIAVLGGTGKEGSGLALRWAHAGHEVIVGSRDADKARRAAEELNQMLGQPRVQGMDNLSAAQAAEVVVLSVPYAAHLDTLNAVRSALAGKVVIDVTVPLDPQDITRVRVPPAGSAAKEAQAAYPRRTSSPLFRTSPPLT